MTSTPFEAQYKKYFAPVEAFIAAHSLGKSVTGQAADYSLRAGGKRLRPILLLDMASQGPHTSMDPVPAAVAVECIHTFSLIHDDMPCIDNAALRRGKPSCHKAYGQWQALLAGDLLLNEAFRIISQHYDNAPAGYLTSLVAETTRDLIEGERADIEAENLPLEKVDMDFIYRNKTAAMVSLPIKMGLSLAGWNPTQIAPYAQAAEDIGIAFQIVDDLLDSCGDPNKMGKDVGQDERKKTYLKQHGQAWCEQKAEELKKKAKETFQKLPEPDFMLEMCNRFVKRSS